MTGKPVTEDDIASFVAATNNAFREIKSLIGAVWAYPNGVNRDVLEETLVSVWKTADRVRMPDLADINPGIPDPGSLVQASSCVVSPFSLDDPDSKIWGLELERQDAFEGHETGAWTVARYDGHLLARDGTWHQVNDEDLSPLSRHNLRFPLEDALVLAQEYVWHVEYEGEATREAMERKNQAMQREAEEREERSKRF